MHHSSRAPSRDGHFAKAPGHSACKWLACHAGGHARAPQRLHAPERSTLQKHLTDRMQTHWPVTQVDTHVHHSACMHQKHLLRFIKSKLKKEPDEVVIFRDGKWLTLREVFESLSLTGYVLTSHDIPVSCMLSKGFEPLECKWLSLQKAFP